MKLKQYMYQQGRLRDGMSSIIYKAVIDHGVTSVEDLAHYIKLIEK